MDWFARAAATPKQPIHNGIRAADLGVTAGTSLGIPAGRPDVLRRAAVKAVLAPGGDPPGSPRRALMFRAAQPLRLCWCLFRWRKLARRARRRGGVGGGVGGATA